MWDDLLSALALVLVIRRFCSFLSPAGLPQKMLAMLGNRGDTSNTHRQSGQHGHWAAVAVPDPSVSFILAIEIKSASQFYTQCIIMNNERWLLPEGIEELLPPQAGRLEQLRRAVLDLFHGWGYELVTPPLVEYLDSLLTGTGNDLDLQTFKLTDQLNGRMMGVRADITPQVARIDAHRLSERKTPVRLCYQGTVLHTRGDGLGGPRSFTQVGAELYGHSGVESDAEMVNLMLDTLALAGVDSVYVDLGHVGIFRALTQAAGLDAQQESQLFDALQRKAVPEIQSLLEALSVDADTRQALENLVWLNGGAEVLGKARLA